MKNIYKNYIIVGLTVLVVVLLVIVLLLVLNNKSNFSISNNQEKNTEEKNNIKNNDDNLNNSENQTKEDNKDNTVSDNNTSSNNNNTNPTTNNDTNTSNNNSQNTSNENDVVSYFQNQSNEINSSSDQNNGTLREKIKKEFINIIDFIFYGKEINGYTFDRLTNTAKLKVISIALAIDNKIEQYFPNYKTIIRDKYNDIKGKLAVKYLELTASLCESVGADTCNQAKEDFSNMKQSFGLTWSLLKELASSGKDKIKDYYENEFRK